MSGWDWIMEPLGHGVRQPGARYRVKDLGMIVRGRGTADDLLDPFIPAIERLLGPIELTGWSAGPAPTGRGEVLGAGYEGVVISARLVDGDLPVVIKLGRLIQDWDPASSDFVASSQIMGQDIPGVAKVYGVWALELEGDIAQGHELFCLVRERVSTDWAEFERLVGGGEWPLAEFWEGVADWMPAVASACVMGKPPDVLVQEWGEWLEEFLEWRNWPPARAFFEGVSYLAALRICTGDDIRRDNMGWRFDPDGAPELVIIDLGLSEPRGAWTKSPRRPNRRRRRRR